jgi:hypothetical protein
VHRGGCSWRSRSGCEPGKTIGVGVADVVDEPDERFEVCPDRYARCKESLDNAFDTVTVDTVRVRRRWRMWIPIITVSHRVPPGVTALRRVPDPISGFPLNSGPGVQYRDLQERAPRAQYHSRGRGQSAPEAAAGSRGCCVTRPTAVTSRRWSPPSHSPDRRRNARAYGDFRPYRPSPATSIVKPSATSGALRVEYRRPIAAGRAP